MSTISSANKDQSLTEKEKKIEEENASKLVSALGVDSTFMSDHLALRALPLHRFGKNRGSRSITKAWKSAAVVHDATYLLYRRNTRDASSSSSIVSNENALPKRVRETFCDGEIESLARFDVAGKFALKLINKTLRTSIKFKKIGTVKKQIDRFGENGEGLQCAVVAAVDPRRVYADDKVVPLSKKEEEDKEKLSSLPPSEKDISDARRVSKVVRARQLAGIAHSDDTNIDLSALQQRFRVCAVARPNNDGASLYFNANWAPIVLKEMVIRGAYAAGVCEWNDLGVWRGANVEKVRSIFVSDEASDDDAATRTRIVLRFPKKGAGRKGDAVFDNDGNTKIGTIDRVTPVSIAVAVASASVLTTAWSQVVTNSKRKKGGVKVLVKSATKGDVIAFASSAKETNGDFSWW